MSTQPSERGSALVVIHRYKLAVGWRRFSWSIMSLFSVTKLVARTAPTTGRSEPEQRSRVFVQHLAQPVVADVEVGEHTQGVGVGVGDVREVTAEQDLGA